MPPKRKVVDQTAIDPMMMGDFQMPPQEGVVMKPNNGNGGVANIDDPDSSEDEGDQGNLNVPIAGAHALFINPDGNLSAAERFAALERENEHLFLSSKALKTARENFPWLMAFGRPCVSDRRMVMSPEEPGRKKCRKLYCLICARFNPDTPWAVVRARKFEKKYFTDHQASVHHLKAVQVMRESGFENTDLIEFLDPAVFANAEAVYPEMMPNQVPSYEANSYVIATEDNTYSQQLYLGGAAGENEGIHSLDEEQGKSNRKRKRSVREPSIGIDGEILPEPEGDEEEVKIKFMPAWLKTAGRLRMSTRMAALLPTMTKEERSKVKKKYRDCYCSICAEFQPGSPWSQVRGRKYEKALLIQHERSICHRKALAIQAGEPFEPLAQNNKSVVLPQQQLNVEEAQLMVLQHTQQASVEDIIQGAM